MNFVAKEIFVKICLSSSTISVDDWLIIDSILSTMTFDKCGKIFSLYKMFLNKFLNKPNEESDLILLINMELSYMELISLIIVVFPEPVIPCIVNISL